MAVQALLTEPGRIDEPHSSLEFSAALSQVATEGRPLIVRRAGADFAAVISLDDLALLRELASHQEAEGIAARICWGERVPTSMRPPQEWFDATDNPFAPEENPAP